MAPLTALQDLAASGLVPSDMQVDINQQGTFGVVAGYTINYYLPDGTRHPHMHRIKMLGSPDGKRYTQPSTEAIVAAGGDESDATYPYLNPTILGGATWEVMAAQPKKLYIVEGEKKATAAGKFLKVPAIGIGGCQNAVRRDGQGVMALHPVIRGLLRAGDAVEVVFDADLKLNPNVNRAAGTLRRALMRQGIQPTFVVLPVDPAGRKMGLDDWLLTIPAGDHQQAFAALPREDGKDFDEDHESLWQYLGLMLSEKGRPLANISNLSTILTKHERLYDRLWYDPVTDMIRTTLTKDGRVAEVEDGWITTLTTWIQQRVGIPMMSVAMVDSVRQIVREKFPRSPLAERIKATVWDGQPRLEKFLTTVYGTPDNPYCAEVGKKWITGAVARLMEPGVQFDYMAVLEGEQGIGKSRSLRLLGGDYYVDLKGDMTNKDFLVSAHRGWICDLSELGAMRRAESAHIKAMITTPVDTFRRPYEKSSVQRARSFIIVGTTNATDYMTDTTGNRRFWPIPCRATVAPKVPGGARTLNFDWIVANRDQMFAEAYTLYLNGYEFWSAPADAAAQQDKRLDVDPISDTVRSVVETQTHHQITTQKGDGDFIAASEVLFALATPDNQSAQMGRRIRPLMLRMGWEPHVFRANNPANGLTLRGQPAGAPTSVQCRGYIRYHHLLQGVDNRLSVE